MPFGTYDVCVERFRGTSGNNVWYRRTNTNIVVGQSPGTRGPEHGAEHQLADRARLEVPGHMRRLRDESGMTLMEVLVASTVGMVVLLAMFAMLDSTVRMNTGVMSRTDSMQRGRVAMDVLTQELRSQVCLVDLTPAIVPGSDNNSVSFYSDFSEGDGVEPPTKRKLTYDPATGNIRTDIYAATAAGAAGRAVLGQPHDDQRPARERQAREDRRNQNIPFLRYYAYEWVGETRTGPRPPSPSRPRCRRSTPGAWRGSTSPSWPARPARRATSTA